MQRLLNLRSATLLLVVAVVALALSIGGCSQKSVDPIEVTKIPAFNSSDNSNSGTEPNVPSDGDRAVTTLRLEVANPADSSQGGRKPEALPAALSAATYATAVNIYGPWYKSEWLVAFFLPYNPGTVNFQGRAPWGWQTFSGGYASIWDAQWTPSGFRVRILVGLHVVGLCSTYYGMYRRVY